MRPRSTPRRRRCRRRQRGGRVRRVGGRQTLRRAVERLGRVRRGRRGLQGRAGRPGQGPQTIFVDFDGARINTGIFGGPGVRELTGLRGFLGGWGLGVDDENALIDAILASITESVHQDMLSKGLNPNVAVKILNSRDHADPFGKPNVSRLIVGGTIARVRDRDDRHRRVDRPGQLRPEDSALILLDLLSAVRDRTPTR